VNFLRLQFEEESLLEAFKRAKECLIQEIIQISDNSVKD